MARITVEDCLTKIDNQYDLVLLAKERTTQLNAGSPMLVEEDNDKRTIISLREIGDGKISVGDLEKSAISRLRREPDESFDQAVRRVDDYRRGVLCQILRKANGQKERVGERRRESRTKSAVVGIRSNDNGLH